MGRDVVATYTFDKGCYSYLESDMTHNFFTHRWVLLLGAAGIARYQNIMKLYEVIYGPVLVCPCGCNRFFQKWF